MSIRNFVMTKPIPMVGYFFRCPSVLPVIYYHDIVNDGNGYSYMRTDVTKYEYQMKYLCDNGYKSLLFSELPKDMKKKKSEKTIIVTYDDGFESNYLTAFPIAKKYGIKMNIFMTSDFIGKENYLKEEQIKEMMQSGLVEFGFHTKSHCDCRTLIDKTLLDTEIISAHTSLEQTLGKKVADFCFPYGYYNKEVVDSITKTGVFDRIYTSNYVKPIDINGCTVCGRIGVDNNWDLSTFVKHVEGRYRIMHYYSKLRVGVPAVR